MNYLKKIVAFALLNVSFIGAMEADNLGINKQFNLPVTHRWARCLTRLNDHSVVFGQVDKIYVFNMQDGTFQETEERSYTTDLQRLDDADFIAATIDNERRHAQSPIIYDTCGGSRKVSQHVRRTKGSDSLLGVLSEDKILEVVTKEHLSTLNLWKLDPGENEIITVYPHKIKCIEPYSQDQFVSDGSRKTIRFYTYRDGQDDIKVLHPKIRTYFLKKYNEQLFIGSEKCIKLYDIQNDKALYDIPFDNKTSNPLNAININSILVVRTRLGGFRFYDCRTGKSIAQKPFALPVGPFFYFPSNGLVSLNGTTFVHDETLHMKYKSLSRLYLWDTRMLQRIMAIQAQ